MAGVAANSPANVTEGGVVTQLDVTIHVMRSPLVTKAVSTIVGMAGFTELARGASAMICFYLAICVTAGRRLMAHGNA